MPAQRFYPASQTALAKVAIWAQWWRDVYLVLGEVPDGDAWDFRVTFMPGVRWIWLSGLLMVLAAVLGLRRAR